MKVSKCKFVLTLVLGVVLAASSSVMAEVPAPVAVYTLDGTLTESSGGPPIVANGGTLGATGYSFGPNQGLSLVGVVNQTDYSIEMVFHFDNVEIGKIVDFNNLMSDSGYYAGNFFPDEGNPMFFDASIPGAGVPGIGQILGPGMVLQNGVNAHFVVTRDGSTGEAVAYVNCVEHIQFNTANGMEAIFLQDIAHFFIDDFAIPGQPEGRSGFVDYINIYFGALTPSEVASLAGISDCDDDDDEVDDDEADDDEADDDEADD